MYIYIFNSKLKWVAFEYKGNVFSVKKSNWIDWIDRNEIYSPAGEYLGILEKFAEPHYYRAIYDITKLHKFNKIPAIPPLTPLPPIPPLGATSTNSFTSRLY